MERFHFEEELQALKNRLLSMGGLVEDRVHRAVQALMERDLPAAEIVSNGDQEVNDLQIEIDDRCVKVLALQQPMATDLRLITSAIKINADLERIGDQAVNIAESAIKVLNHSSSRPPADLRRIAELAERMTRDSLDSFVRKDVALARFVIMRDDEVDRLKDKLFGELIATMVSDPQSIPDALSFILISRNLERIADHATNIAEDVIFMVEAKDIRHHHLA
jgi:phosphate transport system protein